MPGACLSSPQKEPRKQGSAPGVVSLEASAVPAEPLCPTVPADDTPTIAEPAVELREVVQPMDTDAPAATAQADATAGATTPEASPVQSPAPAAAAAEPAEPTAVLEEQRAAVDAPEAAAAAQQPAAAAAGVAPSPGTTHRRTASGASHRRTGSGMPVHTHRRSISGQHRRGNSGPKLPTGPEPVAVEVEYIPTDQLQPLEQPQQALQALPESLGSGDWLENSRGLNTARQLLVHHKELVRPQLPSLMPLLLKLVKNPRSVLCKTAIMTTGDLFTTFGDAVLPYLSQPNVNTGLLINLLLKASSNDKKFVVEEARTALNKLAFSTPPVPLLENLAPYVAHKSPKVRGHVAMTMLEAVGQASDADINAYGRDKLLKVAGRYINDNTANARESARQLVVRVRSAYTNETGGGPEDWELCVKGVLMSSEAMAVLKV